MPSRYRTGEMMKLVKTSVVACVLSALLGGQVLAQDFSTDSKSRGGMQGKSIQGGMSDDDEDSTTQLGAADRKAGMKPVKSTKGAAGHYRNRSEQGGS